MKRIISVVLLVVMLFALAACTSKPKTIVTLYFPNENMELCAEQRAVDGKNLEKAVIEELVKGPTLEGLTPSVRGNVKVLGAETVDGVCTINLSKDFPDSNTGGSLAESIAIYSIVNSLCSLINVDSVKFNIEGDTDYEFGGHFYMGEPFAFDRNMIRFEDRPE